MRRVKPAKSLDGARFLLMRRRIQRHLPRRPMRLLGWITSVCVVSVGAVATVDFLDRGSRLQTALLTATETIGLSVQNVEVQGRATTPADDVLKALDVARGTPILAVQPDRARQRLETLPWVRSATVERRLPDTVLVRLEERQPLALWQHEGKQVLVDTDGVVVTAEHLERYASLLLIVGDGAPEHARDLINVLGSQPELAKRVQSAVWVGQRRWELQLQDDITVELPESGIADAWAKLAEIERSHALLARDVTRVDLRLNDRVVVQSAMTAPKSAPKPGSTTAKPAAKGGTKPT
jgi:cell division protein FtsQ